MPKLTKRMVDLAQPTEKERIEWDDEVPGFGLRIKPSGVKSYLIQYRQNGISRRMTIGRHGILTAEEARRLARQHLGSVVTGSDPALARQTRNHAPTMRDLADNYLERHALPNKRPHSIRNDRLMLDKHILPELGRLRVIDLGKREVETVLLAMRETPYQANRVRALLSKMLSLAISWGWRTDNPVLGTARFHEERRERWLNEAELDRLFAALAAHPNQKSANAVRLLVLTGARRGEVLSATWDQFDLARGVWTKPAHATKQKRTEHVPLSSQALDLVKALHADRLPESPFLFPGETPDHHLMCIKNFWESIRLAAGFPEVRIHDLRHTFASHLVSSGVSLPIVGRLLGHTQPQTTQRYAHLADDPLREAAERFGGKFAKG